MNPHDHPTALKDLQDSIYREKVLRARRMTPEERFDSGFELTNHAFALMLGGAMAQLGLNDEAEGRQALKDRLARLRAVHDYGRYTTELPSRAPA